MDRAEISGDENTDGAVIVALGSNLSGEYGSSAAVLMRAFDGFGEIGLTVKAKSSIWTSRAWPDPAQPPFANAVALVEAEDRALSAPQALLAALHRLEAAFGRRREVVNGPRVLDLDLIAVGRMIVDEPGLILPHPRAAERRFVMAPLAQIAPAWRHPVTGETAALLAAAATVGVDAAALPLAGRRIGGEGDAP